MLSDKDNRFAQVAVLLEVLGEQDVARLLRHYQRSNVESFEQFLCRRGDLSADDAQRIRTAMSEQFVECGNCYTLVPRQGEGEATCPQCGKRISGEEVPGEIGPTVTKRIAASLVGTALGGVRLESRIASRGPTSVYRGTVLDTGRTVAVKVLAREAAAGARNYIQRFEIESRNAARLKHNNIVEVLACGSHGDYDYIVMEHVEGESVAALLRRRGKLPWREAVSLIEQAADALAYAHAQGIVHRDVKPSNLLLAREGIVKLVDFGLAHETDEEDELIREGYTVGTPRYMSPEQCRGEPMDERSDVYSLGSTFYQMLTAELPFKGDRERIMAAHASSRPVPSPKLLDAELPESVCAVAEKMLEKSRNLRYQGMERLRTDLRSILEGKGPTLAYTNLHVAGQPVPSPTPAKGATAEEAQAKAQRRLARMLVLGAIGLVVVSAAYFVRVYLARSDGGASEEESAVSAEMEERVGILVMAAGSASTITQLLAVQSQIGALSMSVGEGVLFDDLIRAASTARTKLNRLFDEMDAEAQQLIREARFDEAKSVYEVLIAEAGTDAPTWAREAVRLRTAGEAGAGGDLRAIRVRQGDGGDVATLEDALREAIAHDGDVVVEIADSETYTLPWRAGATMYAWTKSAGTVFLTAADGQRPVVQLAEGAPEGVAVLALRGSWHLENLRFAAPEGGARVAVDVERYGRIVINRCVFSGFESALELGVPSAVRSPEVVLGETVFDRSGGVSFDPSIAWADPPRLGIRRCTFYKTRAVFVPAASETWRCELSFLNNIVSDAGAFIAGDVPGDGYLTSNSNAFWKVGGADADVTRARQQALGGDRNSVFADPRLRAPDEGDFRPESGSPARKMGVRAEILARLIPPLTSP